MAIPASSEEPPTGDPFVPLTSSSLHDLAGPINQVCSMAKLLVKKYRDRLDSEADDLVGFIESSTDRVHSLLRGLSFYLEVVGLPGPWGWHNGNTLLAKAIESLRPAIDRDHAHVTYDQMPDLYCNPAQIQFVFASLIENSIRFRREQMPRIHISATVRDADFVLSVQDNGIGIARGQNERIFRLFARVHHKAEPGVGVGLAIVRRVVELHSGQLWVESEIEHGTTVFFTLPRANVPKCSAIA